MPSRRLRRLDTPLCEPIKYSMVKKSPILGFTVYLHTILRILYVSYILLQRLVLLGQCWATIVVQPWMVCFAVNFIPLIILIAEGCQNGG